MTSHPIHVPFEWWYDDFSAELDEREGVELDAAAGDDEGTDDEIARASEELESDEG